MDELLKRVNRYTRQCLTERTDPDFADAVEEMKNTLMAFGANAYRYASIALEHEIEIGKLKSELEDGKPKWIPVTDKLPQKCQFYLVTDFGVVEEAYYNSDGVWFSPHGDKLKAVSHWMPLPEPPKEEKDG